MLLAFAASAAGCSPAKVPAEPPTAAPRSLDDVVGIWRTVRQSVFELRSDGTFVLISAVTRASDGRYALDGDRLRLSPTESCPGSTGTYSVAVARGARMRIAQPDDACAPRSRVLTADPWVYEPR